MLLVRVLIFFVLVMVTSTYTTHKLSEKLLFVSLETKNQLIDEKNKQIDNLIKMYEYEKIVNQNLKDIIRVGVKNNCLKNEVYEQYQDTK